MPRALESMGHSVTDDGCIHHGVIGSLPGTPVSVEEAEALKAARPQVKAASPESPPAGDGATAALILGLQDQITRARGEIAALRAEFEAFTATLSKE